MRIAILMKRYSLRRGGGEYDLVRLSGSLADRGHEVHLFVHDVEGEPDPRLAIHSVPMVGAWAPLKIWSFARNAPREVARSDLAFDVVHAMTQAYPSDLYWNGGGLQINWLRARYGPKALSTAWLNPRHAANLSVERRIFTPGNYRYVVSLSNMERDQIVDHYGVPSDRFLVIPNGINPERFNLSVREQHREEMRRELGIPPGRKMLLVVGTDGVRKGFAQLFAALGALEQPFAGLLVIAGNDPASRWEGQVRDHGLEGKVRFHGRESHIERLYAAADLVVMASLFEGYGNVIPEAMACGCPVLTTKSVGAADFVEHEKTGWVIPSCKETPVYSKTLDAALGSADLETTGLRAAEKIAPITWDWTVDQLEEVYRRIAEEKKSDRS
jgi:UDP-glucose:(heptosyl)LPS alpha-1,3-glucosyltransferase